MEIVANRNKPKPSWSVSKYEGFQALDKRANILGSRNIKSILIVHIHRRELSAK